MDILYVSQDNINIINYIKEIFNPKEIYKNGDVISFSYEINSFSEEYFQIDLIKCENESEKLSMSKYYYSYGDLGNILGRITKKYDIRFGHKGLFINLLDETIKF